MDTILTNTHISIDDIDLVSLNINYQQAQLTIHNKITHFNKIVYLLSNLNTNVINNISFLQKKTIDFALVNNSDILINHFINNIYIHKSNILIDDTFIINTNFNDVKHWWHKCSDTDQNIFKKNIKILINIIDDILFNQTIIEKTRLILKMIYK